jgi:hypothetical protein
MSGNQGIASLRQLAFGDVQVSATDTAGTNLQEHLPCTWVWLWHVADTKRLLGDRAGICENGGFHRCFVLAMIVEKVRLLCAGR